MVENLKESIGDEFLKDYGLSETDSFLQVEGKLRPCKAIRFDGNREGASSGILVSYLVDRMEGKRTFYIRIFNEVSGLTQEQYRVAAAYIHAFVSSQEGDIQEIFFRGNLDDVPEDALQAFWNIKPPGRGKIKKK